MLVPALIPFLSFLLQVYPRFFNKYFGVDVWTRLLEAGHIRKNNHRIPHKELKGQFIIDGKFDYPPVFPWLLSFFSQKNILKIQSFVAPLFDALQVFLVYLLAFFLTGSVTFSLVAQLVYMLTPMIALENSYLTPRSLGYLNFSLAVIPLLFYVHLGHFHYFLIGLVFTAAIFLTHRFATQSFLFISIFFTFFLNTPVFMQAFFLGFAAAVFLTKGYYLRVLKGHLYNIYFWIKNLDFRFAHQIRGNIEASKQADWVGKIYKLLSVLSPVAVFGLNPWATSGFTAVIGSYLGLWALSPLLISMVAWVLFFYFFGVVVLKVKYLMPIGEGQRYMEMATVPSAFLSSFILFELLQTSYKTPALFLFITLCVFNLGLIIVIQVKGVIKDRNRSLTGNLEKVFSFINKQKKIPRIICVPHQNTTLTIFHTKAQVFVNADNPGLMKIQEVYPLLKTPLKDLAKKYNLSHALVRESFASLKELKLKKKDIVFKAKDVVLVSLK